MAGIFISYAHRDIERVRPLYEHVRSAFPGTWMDVDSIPWGGSWQARIQDALASCQAYLIVVGEGGLRPWVLKEFEVVFARHVDTRLPILPVLLPGTTPEDLPPFLKLFQAKVFPAELTELDYSGLTAELEVLLGGQGFGEPQIEVPTDGPFPGLEAFGVDRAQFFVGRERETLELLERFDQRREQIPRRWLQIEGASGAGKSSLVRAALMPAIRCDWTVDPDRSHRRPWVIGIMRPGEDPVRSLVQALVDGLRDAKLPLPARQKGEGFDALLGELREGSCDALGSLLREALPALTRGATERRPFLLVVDQLEEAFIQSQPHARARFADLIAAALKDAEGPLRLITTVRSDFLLRFEQLSPLHRLLNTHSERYALATMDRTGLWAAVKVPAYRAGLRWVPEGLARTVVDQAEVAGLAALPLMGNLLRQLWECGEHRELRETDFDKLDGVGGALARSAKAALEGLGKSEREAARRMLLALVDTRPGQSYVRRTAALSEVLDLGKRELVGPKGLLASTWWRLRLTSRTRISKDADESMWQVFHRLTGGAPTGGRPGIRLVVAHGAAELAVDLTTIWVDLAHEALLHNAPNGQPYWPQLREWADQDRRRLEDRALLGRRAEHWRAAGSPGFGSLLTGGRELRNFRRAGADSNVTREYLRVGARQYRLTWLGVWALTLAVALTQDLWWLDRNGRDLSHQYGPVLAFFGLYHVEPQMIELVAGECPANSPLSGQRRGAADSKRFAIGKYEVTFEEYDRFAAATGRIKPSAEDWGRGRRPVINVSWNDAQNYAKWLSKQTGRAYRLPTEAEWEYAARACTETEYWWGDDVRKGGKVWANCDGCGGVWAGKQTAPVGSFEANPFGLHDTAGNVWEWTCSAYVEADGIERRCVGENEASDRRVIRGGSWNFNPKSVRTANRGRGVPGDRTNDLGFRLAQNL